MFIFSKLYFADPVKLANASHTYYIDELVNESQGKKSKIICSECKAPLCAEILLNIRSKSIALLWIINKKIVRFFFQYNFLRFMNIFCWTGINIVFVNFWREITYISLSWISSKLWFWVRKLQARAIFRTRRVWIFIAWIFIARNFIEDLLLMFMN